MRTPKPFYKKTHKAWYLERGGRQIRLAATEPEAWTEYHRIMASDLPVTSKTTVTQLVDQFLAWLRANRKPGTHEWYKNHCESFTRHVKARLLVADVRPYHVDKWLQTRSHTSPTYRNGGCRAVAGCFNWAKKQGLIPASPIAGMDRPRAQRRDAYLTLEQWAALIALVDPGDPFYDLLTFLWETGCRPHEARIARANNLDRGNREIRLDLADSKGGAYQRV
ncbi:MAG TPA: hypothetical protein PJ982_07310, partial [Lacipirellulaceae bacterium]|nr:hypothetical protein [Lacipirellulaceae bacterium]